MPKDRRKSARSARPKQSSKAGAVRSAGATRPVHVEDRGTARKHGASGASAKASAAHAPSAEKASRWQGREPDEIARKTANEKSGETHKAVQKRRATLRTAWSDEPVPKTTPRTRRD